ncbi:alpha/beta hydrolase [Tateyamaria armeniaca]|uniref:Alpha/beta hydrolase n=1 Tax=Tateyamaria armeniaca TaxID=2518930 RepID=A0ABW8UTG0_9RHOB
MSLRSDLLNQYLRWTERTFLTYATSPRALRASFEIKAQLFFRGSLAVAPNWRDLAGRPALEMRPKRLQDAPTLLYFHGGGYVFGSPRTICKMAGHLAKKAGFCAVIPEYPLAPEHPFPAAVDHGLAAYQALLDEGIDPSQIIIGGDSAGGNLALSVLGQLVAIKAPMPAGVFGLSPITDFAFSGASMIENDRSEVILPPSRFKTMVDAYLCGQAVDDPRVSPLHADFTGAPPVWLAVSDSEILRDDTLRMAEALRAQGVDVDLTVEHNLPHVWPMFHTLIPEAHATLDAIAQWMINQTAASAPTR